MTDEEKAEEYVKETFGERDWLVSETYKNIYLVGLAEGKKDRNCVNCSNHGKQFEVMKLEKENTRLSKMLNEAIGIIEQEDIQCKMCSFYLSCRDGDCAYKDEIPTFDVIRAELEKRVEKEE